MSRILIISIIYFMFSQQIEAQDFGKLRAMEIDNMVLLDRYLIKDAETGGAKLSSTPTNSFDTNIVLHFDENRSLRKFSEKSSYPDSNSSLKCYYNAKGELIYLSYIEEQPEGYSYNITAYVDVYEYGIVSVKYDYIILYTLFPESYKTHTVGVSDKFPIKIGEWQLENYLTTDSLKKNLTLNSIVE